MGSRPTFYDCVVKREIPTDLMACGAYLLQTWGFSEEGSHVDLCYDNVTPNLRIGHIILVIRSVNCGSL